MNNKERILNYLEKCQSIIQKILKENEYIDDCKWGENCFEICVFECKNPPHSKLVYTFTFIFDKNDIYGRSFEDQVNEWIKEIIENYE